MKEVLVAAGPKCEIIDSSVPKPNADQICIKVVFSGSNPKDWKRPEWSGGKTNQGDDIAGFVHSVGDNITEFRPGDRVAAFHEMMTPHGSYAEYAIAPGHTTFHLPKKTSFEEAATIPLAGMTAAIGLYLRLGLPEPWRPALSPIPIIIYGGSSAVGSFAIKLAQLSNIHPIIAVAGNGEKHVESLISRNKGDTIVDYRKGDGAVVQGIKDALKTTGHGKVEYAFDATSEKNSYVNISKVLDPHGTITLVLPGKDYEEIPKSITKIVSTVGASHMDVDPESPQGKAGIITGSKEFAYTFFRFFTRGLQQGYFSGHPYEVVPGGLAGVEEALRNLKEGKASAVKYVFRISDTEGVGKD
ncbi:MAG: hypothetical protein M1827_003223 [Pycnora praestabilis]|nr:MAG: hypothetical protein M1827_003223 [Pycnora praestabilis]